MPQPGQMLGDRYRLDDRIAAGGMGEVWRASDTVLGRNVAIKTLLTDRVGDPGFETRFRHEARTMAALHHPGVADVYDFGESGSIAYIVMERVDGTPLNQLLAQRGRLTAAETMSIVAQAGKALEAAHRNGIVHRDVKPGNLIIKPDGTVVLVDFGIARSTESVALTAAAEVVGTALYMAPEQVSKETLSPAVDIYALGAVGYHCLVGRPPFTGDNPIAIAMQHVQNEPAPLPPSVPGPVQAVIMRALRKVPHERFPSAAAMADAAERAGDAGAATGILATAIGAFGAIGGAAAAGPGSFGGTRPGSNGLRPGTNGLRPGSNGLRPGSNGLRPGTNSFGQARPGTNGIGTGTNGMGTTRPGTNGMGTTRPGTSGMGTTRPGTNGFPAVGSARPPVPPARSVSGDTSYFVPSDPVPAGTRRSRTPWLLAAAAALLLIAGGGVLLSTTDLFGGGTPSATTPAPVDSATGGRPADEEPAATQQTQRNGNGNGGTRTRTTTPQRSSSPTPSRPPSSAPRTSSTPTETVTTTPTDNSGENGDDGGDDGNEEEGGGSGA